MILAVDTNEELTKNSVNLILDSTLFCSVLCAHSLWTTDGKLTDFGSDALSRKKWIPFSPEGKSLG